MADEPEGGAFDPESGKVSELDAKRRSVEEMARNGGPPSEDEPEYLLEGSSPQLTLKGIGPKPTRSTLVVKKAEIGVAGQFNKHEELVVLQEVHIDDVQFPTNRDKDGYILDEERRHVGELKATKVATPHRVARLLAELAAGPDGDAETIERRVLALVEPHLEGD